MMIFNKSDFIKKIFLKGISIVLVMTLFIAAPYYPGKTAFYHVFGETEGKILSAETFYHLDMGVQLVSYNGSVWEGGYEYGVSTSTNINTSIGFNEKILVREVYPLESIKGQQRYDFCGVTATDNIPKSLGSGEEAYDSYYKDYSSKLITVDSYNGAGNTASFNYAAFLDTLAPLEVIEYGELGRGEYIYSLFGGASKLQADQPAIYSSVSQALSWGASGTGGNSKLYLIFCPNVIEYQKYIEVGDLMADLELPASVKQGETYTVKDASFIGDGLIVETAVLEFQIGPGGAVNGGNGSGEPDWEFAAEWAGTEKGKNTGGYLEEQAGEIGTVSYRLTVTADNGQTDQVIRTVQITDGRDIQGNAVLNLQPVTYEGHPAWAVDETTFTVDGENYSASRAYEEKIASNSFHAQSGSGGSVQRKNPTEATVTFPTRGFYQVELEVNLANDMTLQDTKPIEVRKTPAILDSLGGFQKQNRKQILTAAVATTPGKSIIDYYIELIDKETGEKITLTKEAPQKNNATMKTREIKTLGGMNQIDPNANDPYWTTFTVEFLTKTPDYKTGLENQGQEFEYKIWVKDGKGDTDLVEKTFQVVPDLPPVPSVQMADTFLREKGTNIAEIEIKDTTTTDGDQLERSWSIDGAPVEDMEEFQDFSFDSRQHIQFEKTGVGHINIQLNVRDKWIEPTLEEYVTEADREAGEVTGDTEVINIAPTVSLKPVNAKEANLYITATLENSTFFEAQLNSMKARFIEKGVTPQIKVIKRAPADAGGYRQVYYKTWKSAMWCASTCREIGPIYDSNYVYTIQSNSIVSQNYSQVCNGTHTIYAESVGGIVPNWSYTVNQSASFFIKLDNKEKYVYVICRDLENTIVLNRTTGAEVTTIPVALNGEIFLNLKDEIFVADSSKIAKYNPKTTILETVSGGGSLTRLIEGKINYVGNDPSGKLGNRFYIGQYDMDQGISGGKALPEIPSAQISWTAGGKSSITPADMDINGKVIFTQTYNNSSYNTGQNATIWVADSNTQQVKCAPLVAPIGSVIYYLRGLSVGFVTDSTGEGKYIYLSYYEDENRTTTTVRWYFKLFDMKMVGEEPMTQVMSTGRQPNNYNYSGISYAKIHEAENKIYILRGNAFQGSDWGGVQTGERMTINLPSFIKGEAVAQWDVADEYATENEFLSGTYYFYEQWLNPENRVKIFKNTVTDQRATERSIKKNISDREEENTYILTDLSTNQTDIESAIDNICNQAEQKTKAKTGLELEPEEGITRKVDLKTGSQYLFEFDMFTTSGGVSRVFYPYEYLNFNQATFSHYKDQAAQLDFTNPASVSSNNYYTYSTSCYLEGRGGYGSGYYGKKNQSRSYSFSISQNMEKEGYVEFDMFNYFGYQVTGGWSVAVDGNLYETRQGSMDEHKTIFLEAGPHQIVFSGWITNGYYGYIGISNINTIYYEFSSGNRFMEKFSNGSDWNSANGSFKTPPEPLFNVAVETKTNILRENFSGNKVNLTNYLRFTNNTTCPWGFNGTGGYASMGSTYQTSATGSFGVAAPADKHLIVSYNEKISIERAPTTTTVTGASKMIGRNTFFVAAGQTFFRNFDLQRGRSGGYGSVRIENIKIIEVPASVPAEAVFGANGAGALNIGTRTSPFYIVNLISQESNSYLWKSFTGLDSAKTEPEGSVSLAPKDLIQGAASLLKNFKLYEVIGETRLLVLKQAFQNLIQVAADQWNSIPAGEEIKITTLVTEEEAEPSLVYKKGQLVAYSIIYDDYEEDPSRRQYWKYYHVQMNDGEHPGATQLGPDGALVPSNPVAPVLDKPIDRFYIDGKYIVEHWQEDNTNRTPTPLDADGYPAGNPAYDKLSNVETLTFYVEGTSEAPWIKEIQLGLDGALSGFSPLIVKEGDDFAIQIKIDDLEKDILQLRTEVYKEGKLIYTHYKEGIQALGEEYPPVITGNVGIATPGKYQVVCTVRDQTGAGLGTYQFTVIAGGKIIGEVSHTVDWELNRINFNLKHKTIGDSETPRGSNLFWPGEVFVLNAEIAGTPTIVTGEILGYKNEYSGPKYSEIMTSKGIKNSKGELLYEGEIWDKTMLKAWSKKDPIPLTFRFTAIYGAYQIGPGGTIEAESGVTVKTHDVQVIVDDRESFLLLHRVW